SVTSASAIFCSVSQLPAPRLVCSAGAGAGIAEAAPGSGGLGPGFSSPMGVTGFGLAVEGSGASPVFSFTSLAESSLPLVTLSITWLLTSPALPDEGNSSASSSVFGEASAIALLTAAMNAALSKTPGLAAPILSAWAALAWLSVSLPGGTAAPWASATLDLAEGCFFWSVAAPWILDSTALNLGSSWGGKLAGA